MHGCVVIAARPPLPPLRPPYTPEEVSPRRPFPRNYSGGGGLVEPVPPVYCFFPPACLLMMIWSIWSTVVAASVASLSPQTLGA